MIHRYPDNKDPQYIEFKVGPFMMKFGGRELFNVIVTLIAVGMIAWLVHDHDEKTNKTLEQSIKSIDDNTESLNVLIYVNSLPIEERTKLNLQKPKKLREMERAPH